MRKKSQEEINTELYARLEKLEKVAFPNTVSRHPKTSKVISLAEIVRKKKPENGQQKIAAIVGYYEKVKGAQVVTQADMRSGWKEARFNGGFKSNLVIRAEKDGLVSSYGAKDSYVLTQTGEEFWEELTK